MQRLLQCRRGATAIEYGLIVALLAVALIVALTAMTNNLEAAFQTAADTLRASVDAAPN